MNLALLEADLARHGLIPRGGFNFGTDETAPRGRASDTARAVVLVGQAGAASWPHFQAWRARNTAVLHNPLDEWCREVIGEVAARHGARAVSPSDRPYLPFQQWAMRAEGLRPSPVGILMHPEFGLWHAYRGALLFDVYIDFAELREPIHLCDECACKPCLKACPVQAHTEGGFDHAACLTHVRSTDGHGCLQRGCFDRNACPYGVDYRYPTEVQAFHMRAFAGS
jgi:ferredoxin